MRNELKVFENEKFGKLEVLVENGKEYFPAKEIAIILGYKNPNDAILRHCKNEGVVFHEGVINSGLGEQKVNKKYIKNISREETKMKKKRGNKNKK